MIRSLQKTIFYGIHNDFLVETFDLLQELVFSIVSKAAWTESHTFDKRCVCLLLSS